MGALLDEKSQSSVTGISNHERDIAKLEMELDDVITATASANEKLEVASKTASDAELEVSALVRRVQLLEEETKRVTERLAEVVDKLGSVEKSAEVDIKVEESRLKLKELEDLSVSNGVKEDKYEEETKKLYDLFKNAESNAEFGERSVEKLESTIDGLQESLFNEKHDFIELSKRLDQTLNDMMEVQ